MTRRARLAALNSARGRLVVALTVGVLSAPLLARYGDWRITWIGAWDTASLSLLSIYWLLLAGEDAAKTRERAAAEDPGRTLLRIIVVVCSTVSLFASAVVLRGPHSLGLVRDLLLGLTLVAAASAWALMHSSYALHYAHLFYAGDTSPDSLDFPGDERPSGLDFAYFAFTIGMCFQVSDVTISSSRMRRAVLGHAVLSFVFNTLVLALSLNLMLGALS